MANLVYNLKRLVFWRGTTAIASEKQIVKLAEKASLEVPAYHKVKEFLHSVGRRIGLRQRSRLKPARITAKYAQGCFSLVRSSALP